MKVQQLYDLREEFLFCSGKDLSDFFQAQLGDGSPSGYREIPIEEISGWIIDYGPNGACPSARELWDWAIMCARLAGEPDPAYQGYNRISGRWEGEQFKGKLMPYSDCSDAYLYRADFRDTCLVGCSFVGADLTEVDLTGADLRNADFRGAKLYRAKLDGAILSGYCPFWGAYL
jgi:hypothetical protein